MAKTQIFQLLLMSHDKYSLVGEGGGGGGATSQGQNFFVKG